MAKQKLPEYRKKGFRLYPIHLQMSKYIRATACWVSTLQDLPRNPPFPFIQPDMCVSNTCTHANHGRTNTLYQQNPANHRGRVLLIWYRNQNQETFLSTMTTLLTFFDNFYASVLETFISVKYCRMKSHWCFSQSWNWINLVQYTYSPCYAKRVLIETDFYVISPFYEIRLSNKAVQ
jgi:hypothetical protein